ncbi:PAP_fibrillin [Rivularia sp. PCC 7116]|uniref:PAP/fibrillin family protein n=1 Tax=Rivularia sp. PCC 7116 TaxID=373994 RepID=UPI00029F0014|nr:PAP/fibrillin family protein [Rivularia sp. PCC 7116]AFY54063.1 PAP_fibrillin [Rivularia sp. PCC 7116]
MRKTALLELIAGKNLGSNATQTDKQAIHSAIANLEDFNPTANPLESDLLEGDWRLLYTTSTELLNLNRIPLTNLSQIYQCIRVKTRSVYNIAEIHGLPFLEGIVSVAAKFEPVSSKRVQVKFERSIIGLQRLIDYQYPANFIEEIAEGKKFLAIDFPIKSSQQQGWLDITYLDNDLRIGRGNQGSIFVLTKS